MLKFVLKKVKKNLKHLTDSLSFQLETCLNRSKIDHIFQSWVFLSVTNNNSSTPNINFKIPTLPLFISSSSLVRSIFSSYTILYFGELLLCCCDQFGRGVLSRWFVRSLWLSSWGCCGATTKEVSYFYLQVEGYVS